MSISIYIYISIYIDIYVDVFFIGFPSFLQGYAAVCRTSQATTLATL